MAKRLLIFLLCIFLFAGCNTTIDEASSTSVETSSEETSSTSTEISSEETSSTLTEISSEEASSEDSSSNNTSSKDENSSKPSSNTSSKNTTSSNTDTTTSKKKDVVTAAEVYGNVIAIEDGWKYYPGAESENPNFIGFEAKKTYGLYKSKLDGSERTRLVEGKFRCIIIIDGWLYYKSDSYPDEGGLYRIRTDGTQNTVITFDECQSINFVGDKIFYLTPDKTVNVVNNDGSNRHVVSSAIAANWMIVSENTIYTSDGNTFQQINLDGTGHKISPLSGVNFFIVDGEYFYYSRVKDEMTTYYRSRLDMTETIELVTVKGSSGRKSIFVKDGWFYFVKPEDLNRMYRIKTDGTGKIERTNLVG